MSSDIFSRVAAAVDVAVGMGLRVRCSVCAGRSTTRAGEKQCRSCGALLLSNVATPGPAPSKHVQENRNDEKPVEVKTAEELKQKSKELDGKANDEPRKNPRAAVASLEANEAGATVLVLSNSSAFAIKHTEMSQLLAAALAKNTTLEQLELAKCDLDHRDAGLIADALTRNATLRVLNLQNNKITNEGATAIALALRSNRSLTELNLLGQQQAAFGEPCLQNFIDLFDYNVTLTKIVWRLDSRKSFAINKLLVRNNTIRKWVFEGKSVAALYPKNANIPIENLKQVLSSMMRGSMALDDHKVEQEEEGEGEGEEEKVSSVVATYSGDAPLGACPANANHAAKTVFADFVEKVDKKWTLLKKPLVAGTTAVEGEKILASMAVLRPKVELAGLAELTARFRELNKVIPAAVNEANAAANAKASKVMCDKCRTPMTGKGVETTVGGKTINLHSSCFKCNDCKQPLSGKPIVLSEKFYCDDCGRVQFGKQQLKK